MKRYLFPLTISAYLAILLIDTAQLVGLYSDLVGDRGVGISPWLSLFALNLVVLLLSFRKPEWGKANPAGIFAGIIGCLHFLFFTNRIEATSLTSDWFLQIIPAGLFSVFFSYAIYFLADQLASMSEEMAKGIQETRKEFETRMKGREMELKNIELQLKEFESQLNDIESQLKHRETVLNERERQLNEVERSMKRAGKKLKWGRGYIQIDFVDGKWSVKKVA